MKSNNILLKKRIAIFFCLSFLCIMASAYAEQILLKDHRLLEGTVLSEDDKDIYLETKTGLEEIRKEDVVLRGSRDLKDMGKTKEERREEQNAQTAASPAPAMTLGQRIQKYYYDTLRCGINDVPAYKRKISNFFIPIHRKIMWYVESSIPYKLVMKSDAAQKYRRKNPIGFMLSIYCVLLICFAIVLRLAKESFFLLLSFFGIDMKRGRR